MSRPTIAQQTCLHMQLDRLRLLPLSLAVSTCRNSLTPLWTESPRPQINQNLNIKYVRLKFGKYRAMRLICKLREAIYTEDFFYKASSPPTHFVCSVGSSLRYDAPLPVHKLQKSSNLPNSHYNYHMTEHTKDPRRSLFWIWHSMMEVIV